MFKRCLPTGLVLLFLFLAPAAHAFWEPPYITPANPIAGETISMNIRIGVCDAVLFWPGYPQITRYGNAITLVTYGQHWDPGELCTYPTGTADYEIGSLEPGDYTLTVDLNYRDFFGQPNISTLGVVAFTVRGAASPAIPIPTVSSLGLLALFLALIGSACWTLRLRGLGLLLAAAMVCAPGAARAQTPPNLTVQVLVSSAVGAPTAAQIVNYYNATPRVGPPPLQAFTVKSPLTVQYLIPVRAAGDFLAWLNANPNSARAKLENIVLASFATTADVAAALTALHADSQVASANEPPPAQLSSATLQSFSIDSDAFLSEASQYGRDDLKRIRLNLCL